MRTRNAFLVTILTLIMSSPMLSYGQSVPLGMDIDGNPLLGSDCLPIAAAETQFGNIKIAPNGGHARLVAGTPTSGQTTCAGVATTNSADDTLRLVTLTIKPANAAALNVEHRIAFWGTFTASPSAAPPSVWYKLYGFNIGDVKRGAIGAYNDSVRARAWVDPQNNGQWVQITSSDLLKTITATQFTYYNSPGYLNQEFTTLADPRGLMVEFFFKFQQTTDVLKVGVAGILLQNAAPGGPCRDDDDKCQEQRDGYTSPPGEHGHGKPGFQGKSVKALTDEAKMKMSRGPTK